MQIHNRKLAALFALAAAAWVGVLFFFSGQSGAESGALSERVMRILFGWLLDRGMSFDRLHLLVRKGAHFGAFAVEGFLLGTAAMLAMRRRFALPVTAGVCAGVAVLNELHQTLSEGRACSATDMLIDFSGACTGLLAAAVILHAFSIYKKYRYTGD